MRKGEFYGLLLLLLLLLCSGAVYFGLHASVLHPRLARGIDAALAPHAARSNNYRVRRATPSPFRAASHSAWLRGSHSRSAMG